MRKKGPDSQQMTYRSHTSRPHITHRSPKNNFEQYFP